MIFIMVKEDTCKFEKNPCWSFCICYWSMMKYRLSWELRRGWEGNLLNWLIMVVLIGNWIPNLYIYTWLKCNLVWLWCRAWLVSNWLRENSSIVVTLSNCIQVTTFLSYYCVWLVKNDVILEFGTWGMCMLPCGTLVR